jgi:hypothetical protein
LTEHEINDLLQLAGTSPSDKRTAGAWLRDALATAEFSNRVAKQRPLPADHNDLLADIEKKAKELDKRLQRLRTQPYSWRAFWRSSVFGPVRLNRVVVREVLSTLANIVRAAQIGKDPRQGRPRRAGKQHVVDRSLAFFVRYSPLEPSGTPTGAFATFTRAFYLVATKVDPDRHGGLDRQIRQAIKRLPVQRERARHLRKTSNLS